MVARRFVIGYRLINDGITIKYVIQLL